LLILLVKTGKKFLNKKLIFIHRNSYLITRYKSIINAMNSDLYFDGKKYISSSRAAKISGYVNDYIGQLCRDGKLDCRMIGRSWYVSFDSILAHKNSNALGAKNKTQRIIKQLAVASNLPVESSSRNFKSFAPELVPTLSLLPAPRATNLQTEVDFFVQTPLTVSQVVIPDDAIVESVVHKIPVTIKKLFSKPLPYAVVSNTSSTQHEFFAQKFPSLVGGMLAVLLVFIGFRMLGPSHEYMEHVYVTASQKISHSVAVPISTLTPILKSAQTQSASVFTGLGVQVDKMAVNFYHTVNDLLFGARTKILAMIKWPGEKDTSPPIDRSGELARSDPKEGMVVVPIHENTDRAATVAKIKSSFSDDVTVEPSNDGSNGVITPVFKKVKGDDYLYVLVPINN